MHHKSAAYTRTFAAKLARVGLVGLVIIALSAWALPASAAEDAPTIDPSVSISGQTGEHVRVDDNLDDDDNNPYHTDDRRLRYVGSPSPATYDNTYHRGPSITTPSPEVTPITFEGTLDLSTHTQNGSVGAIGLYDKDALAAGGTAHKKDATIYVAYRSASNGYYDIGVSDGDAGGGEFMQSFKRFTSAEIDALEGIVDVKFVIDGTADPADCATNDADKATAAGCMTLTVNGYTVKDSYGSIRPDGIAVEFQNGGHPGWYAAWADRDPSTGVGYALTVSPATAAELPEPTPAPAGSTEELEEYIETEGVDEGSEGFSTGDGEDKDEIWTFTPQSSDDNLSVSGTMDWSAGDSFVDVYGYSTPKFLGTFPVVNGRVILTGLNLGSLGVGSHNLVFVGQTSNALGVVDVFINDVVSTTSTVTVSPTGSASTGTAVTVTGTVSPATAAGTVEIFDGTTSLGEGTATGGVFTVDTSALVVGSHSFTAKFTPANVEDYHASTSATVTFSVNEKELPAEPPAANTDRLQEIIETQDLDVPGTTASFLPSGATEGNALDSLDVSKTFSGTLPWSDTSDSFVDVYAYSSPVFLGTFPVVNGLVQITGVDLSVLAAGGHQLVFIGQTSDTVSVMAITVAADVVPASSASRLALTGSAPAVLPIGAASILLLLGSGLLIAGARRRRA